MDENMEKNLTPDAEQEAPAVEGAPVSDAPAQEAPAEVTPAQQAPEKEPEQEPEEKKPEEKKPEEKKPEEKKPEEKKGEEKPKKKSKKKLAVAAVAVLVLLALLLGGAIFAYQSLFAAQEIVPDLFSHGMLAVQNKEGKWGYINEAGEQVIPFWFDEAYPFHHKDRAIVKLSDMYCFIDRDGNGAGVFADDMEPFGENGLAAVAKRMPGGIKWGYVNEKGTLVIDYQYDEAQTFTFYNRAAVKKDGKWGIINQKGEFVIEANYESARTMYSRARITVENENGDFSLFDKNGKVVVNFGVYDRYSDDYAQGLLAVAKKTTDGSLLWGYIDGDGIEILVCQHRRASAFSDGFACVYSEQTNRWGHIDEEGVLVGDYRYEERYAFQDGYAVVKQGEKYGVIDEKGETVLPFEYEEISIGEQGMLRAPVFVVKRDGRQGVLSKKGEVVLSCEYDSVLFLHGRFFAQDATAEKVTEYHRTAKVAHEFTACVGVLRFADGYYVGFNANASVTAYSENYKVLGNYADICPFPYGLI